MVSILKSRQGSTSAISSGNRRAVALLEVMWDWRSKTTRAGYRELAPRWYRINPQNLSGSRLYSWLGKPGEYFDELLVTNACPELVSAANRRGTPDPFYIQENLRDLQPFSLLLVCGAVAQRSYNVSWVLGKSRILEIPHPANRTWTRRALKQAADYIQHGRTDLELKLENGRLIGRHLIPF